MTYKVKLLRGTKANPELVEVGTVLADRFEITRLYRHDSDEGMFAKYQEGVVFYNRDQRWFGGVSEYTVALYPGTEWVVETV